MIALSILLEPSGPVRGLGVKEIYSFDGVAGVTS